MSPRRQPYTLVQHCLHHLARLFDTLAQLHKSDINHTDICITLNHIIHYLPATVLAAIGETIVLEKERVQHPLLASHIKILLRLKVKNLSLFGSVVQSNDLEKEDASHLNRLSLFYGGSGDRAAKMCHFLSTASQLTHVECRDFCNNSMLGVIASSCHNLYCLDLRCCDVTDEGVLRLCGFQQDLRQCIEMLSIRGKVLPISACSQTLKEVKLSMTKITEAGVAIILLVLTNIHLLRVPDITMEKLFTFLKIIDYRGVQSKLKEFHSREILNDDQLTVLTDLCPNLEYIQMSFVGIFDIDVSRLLKLTSLKRLSGAKFADVNTSALMILLNEMGIQLQNLFLYTYRTKFSHEKLQISHTHLWNMARFCPNLKSLTLDGYSLDDSLPTRIENGGLQFFQNLQTLKLLSMKLSDEDLRMFLYKCTNMKTLELVLKDPHVLHDRLVSELLDGGVWRNLTEVKIMNSPITNKTMFRLVNECPHLQTLGCLYTWLVAKDQISDFKEKVRRENLDIEIY